MINDDTHMFSGMDTMFLPVLGAAESTCDSDAFSQEPQQEPGRPYKKGVKNTLKPMEKLQLVCWYHALQVTLRLL